MPLCKMYTSKTQLWAILTKDIDIDLISPQDICCGYSLEALLMIILSIYFCGEIRKRGASNEYHQHIFLWRNKEARHF